VGSDRIIAMLNVKDNQLVIEEKGIYSIENFIGSRRIMYWQVYMHKTVVSSEFMLTSILKRAKFLYRNGIDLFASPSLKLFLEEEISHNDFERNANILESFALIDDSDISSAIKVWQSVDDKILSTLCTNVASRNLFKTVISKTPFDSETILKQREKIKAVLGVSEAEVDYFLKTETLVNNAYSEKHKQIQILGKNDEILGLAQASDNYNISALSEPVEKHYMCFFRC
jgi:HD superfamily phosphohydrolase